MKTKTNKQTNKQKKNKQKTPYQWKTNLSDQKAELVK